jgi:orotate phosphoribosyltransferase
MTMAETGGTLTGIVYYPVDMEQNDALELYRRTGAYLEGHFRLSSGLHSAGYMQSALVLQRPTDAASLGQGIAVQAKHLRPTVVLSPALGGLIIGHEVARALGVRAIFAERAGGPALTLRRGFTLSASDRVLVIEDVFTTGKSTRETIDVARDAGAVVVGAAAIVDRSGGTIDFGVPSFALVRLEVPTYDAGACPLCAEGIPVVKPGSRPT